MVWRRLLAGSSLLSPRGRFLLPLRLVELVDGPAEMDDWPEELVVMKIVTVGGAFYDNIDSCWWFL